MKNFEISTFENRGGWTSFRSPLVNFDKVCYLSHFFGLVRSLLYEDIFDLDFSFSHHRIW